MPPGCVSLGFVAAKSISMTSPQGGTRICRFPRCDAMRCDAMRYDTVWPEGIGCGAMDGADHRSIGFREHEAVQVVHWCPQSQYNHTGRPAH